MWLSYWPRSVAIKCLRFVLLSYFKNSFFLKAISRLMVVNSLPKLQGSLYLRGFAAGFMSDKIFLFLRVICLEMTLLIRVAAWSRYISLMISLSLSFSRARSSRYRKVTRNSSSGDLGVNSTKEEGLRSAFRSFAKNACLF